VGASRRDQIQREHEQQLRREAEVEQRVSRAVAKVTSLWQGKLREVETTHAKAMAQEVAARAKEVAALKEEREAALAELEGRNAQAAKLEELAQASAQTMPTPRPRA
jgi:hypothetical protein